MKQLITLIILSVSYHSFGQSAWTQPKGDFYTQFSFTTISSYSTIFGDPDYQTERHITDNTLQLYGEYGITDKLTLIANLPFKLIKTGDLTSAEEITRITTADHMSSLGNIEIGLKQKLCDAVWIVSAQLNIEANTNTFDGNSGIRTGYDAWSFTPTINMGRSFNKIYIQGFTGVSLRTNGYSSSFKIGGEIGAKPIKNIWIIGYADVLKSFKNGDVALPLSNQLTSLYVNDQEYIAYGLKGIGELSETFGVTASFGSALSGNNVAKKMALNFGLYHKF